MRKLTTPAHAAEALSAQSASFALAKLAVTAVVPGDDFAARLDAAIERSAKAKLIEAKPLPRSLPPAGPEPTPAGAPFSRLRRI